MEGSARVASLSEYALLGRSGLRVSPLCLGTMTFGTEWGWGSPEETAARIFDRFVEGGGNFVDTADGYTGGAAESLLGKFVQERRIRDRIVLATKFTFAAVPGDPNSGGNSRKNMHRALKGSLARLRTDYVDLYWLHTWDGITPVEEVVSSLDDLVRAGKVRYVGFSDVPAWYLARAHTIAEWRGWERVCALQLEYSLVERNIEREHIPAAMELGIGVCPWSPLASGLLAGKYRREGTRAAGEGRLRAIQESGNPAFLKLFTERNWGVVEELTAVARELGRSPAQVALNWITRRPGVVSTTIGATKLEQIESNLRALDFQIPPALSERLEAASRPETLHPYHYFEAPIRAMLTGGTTVRAEPAWYRR